jgi:hypothetical protein
MGSERGRARIGAALLACASFGWAHVALAEPSASEKAEARAAMAEGRTFRSQRDYEGALRSFNTADKIMHVPTTGLEVARTLEAMGRLVESRIALKRVLSLNVLPSDPPPFQEAMSAAASLYADLDQRIPTITFVTRTAPGQPAPTVWVDGQPVPPSELGSPLRLDPGAHQVSAHFGRLDATQSIELHERDRQPIVLKTLDASTAAQTKPADRASSPWRTIGYVSFATSAAGLVVGTVTGALALSTKHTAEAGCTDGRCPPSTWDAIDRAHAYATVATIGFATFGAGLGLGFTSLALTPATDGRASATSVRVQPRIGLGYVAVDGSF